MHPSRGSLVVEETALPCRLNPSQNLHCQSKQLQRFLSAYVSKVIVGSGAYPKPTEFSGEEAAKIDKGFIEHV